MIFYCSLQRPLGSLQSEKPGLLAISKTGEIFCSLKTQGEGLLAVKTELFIVHFRTGYVAMETRKDQINIMKEAEGIEPPPHGLN